MDREKQLTPISLVAREVSLGDNMSEEDVAQSLSRLLWRLMEEASSAIQSDPSSHYAMERALEYQSLAETLVCFGSTLAAIHDIERHDLEPYADAS